MRVSVEKGALAPDVYDPAIIFSTATCSLTTARSRRHAEYEIPVKTRMDVRIRGYPDAHDQVRSTSYSVVPVLAVKAVSLVESLAASGVAAYLPASGER